MGDDSKKYSLNKKDLLKIAKGAGIAAGGAVCAALLEAIPNIDFGANTAALIVVPLLSVVLNAALKFFQGR